MNPKVCILRTAGTNCDKETAFAFAKAGGEPELVHINQLVKKEKALDSFHILALPGGFSYGDDLGAGKILANELRFKLIDSIKRFIDDGKLIIGICNGFQVLVKSGLLPGNADYRQEVSLVINDSGKFEDRWVYLKSQKSVGRGLAPVCNNVGTGRDLSVKSQKCIWTEGLPEVIYLPVAHGEGKFITGDDTVLKRLKENGQIVFQYCGETGGLPGYPCNPNGSADNIAGICDQTGRILGLMPHPERHIDILQHPRWTNRKQRKTEGDGLQIFKNGVNYVKNNL
ncbi:MAG: phosphoribosylformylglycinamidine synthase subunit PurQ [Candidatus Omnitrophota bacterium]